MKARELRNLGIPRGEPVKLALEAANRLEKSTPKKQLRATIKALVRDPRSYVQDPALGKLADSLLKPLSARAAFEPRAAITS